MNHLLFASMALIVLGWSALQRNAGGSSFSTADFEVLAKFVDAKQVAIPIAGAFLLYLLASLFAHQSRSYFVEAKAFEFKEILHGELSSILLSSASLALVVAVLFIWSGSFSEGFKTMAWWPFGLGLSFFLRPRSQDRYVV